MGELVEHADGVYLGLAHGVYIKDTAIGSSALKPLLHSPPEWWWESAYNTVAPPVKTEEELAHNRLGTAVHVSLLEGKSVFDEAYGVMPSKRTHPEALDTAEDLKRELRKRGLSVTGDKEALVGRLLTSAPELEILQVTQRRFAGSGKRPVTDREHAIIQLLHAMATGEGIRLDIPDGMTLRQAFVGGLAEVSVFWTDDYGIRHRARLDKLLHRVTIDLKTITKWGHANFKKQLLAEIEKRGYFLQVSHYEEGRRQLRRLVDEGKVFGGTPEQRMLLSEIAAEDAWAWMWVFAKTKGYPAIKGIRLNPDTPQYVRAVRDREDALGNFMQYREMFGLEPGKIWIDPQPIWTPEHNEWPVLAGSEAL